MKVNILACSGSGKALGTLTRWVAFELVENVRPGKTDLVCLARMVVHDDEAIRKVADNYNITLDGCPKRCASTHVKNKGAKVHREYMVAKFLVKNRDLKIDTKNVMDPGPDAVELSRRIAGILANDVDELLNSSNDGEEGGDEL